MKRVPFLFAALTLSASASAQPALPLPDGSDAPTFRISGRDTLALEIDGFHRRVDKALGQRRAQVQQAVADLERRKDRGHDEDSNDAPGSADASRRLLLAMQREVELLELAADLAEEAAAQIPTRGDSVPAPDLDVVDLEALIAIEHQLRGARREAAAKAAAARQAAELADWHASRAAADGAPATALDEQRVRLAQAEAEAALARTFVARVHVRNLERRASAGKRSLTLTPAQVAAGQAAVQKAATELEKVQASTERDRKKAQKALDRAQQSSAGAPQESRERRELARAQLRLVDRRREAAEIHLQRAKAMHVALGFIAATETRSVPAELAALPLQTKAETLSRQLEAAESEVANLRSQIETQASLSAAVKWLLGERRKVLQQTVTVLGDSTRALEQAQIVAALAVELKRTPGWGFPLWLAWLLTALAMAAGLVVWHVGNAALLRYTAAKTSPLARLLHAVNPASRARLSLLVGVGWVAVVGVGGAAVVARAVWGIDLGPAQLWGALTYPLFFLDEKGVSLLSLCQFALAVLIARGIARLVTNALSTRVYPALRLDQGLANALNTLLVYVLFTVGVLVGLQFVGVGLSSLALLAGVVGIGIGFGLRNIAENFISGLIILLERPLKIGDWIDIDGTIEGQVQHVRARSTTVVTRDNISVIIPNSEFVGQRITNWSHGDPKVRIRINVGVAYGSDVDVVRRCLIEVARRHGKVLSRPPPEVHFVDFGNSSLNFVLLAWIHEQEHRFRIASDLRFAIDAVFRRTGVTIPFPQRDLHLKSIDPEALRAARSLEDPIDSTASPAGPALADPFSHVEAVLANLRHADDAVSWSDWGDRWDGDGCREPSKPTPPR